MSKDQETPVNITFDDSLSKEAREKFMMSRLQAHVLQTSLVAPVGVAAADVIPSDVPDNPFE